MTPSGRRCVPGSAAAVAALLLALVVALLAAELSMQPSPADRRLLIAVFAAVTAVAAITAVAVRRLTDRSLRRAVVGMVVAAIGVAAFAVFSAAASMFLSAHDLRLVLVALGFGVASGLVLAWSITGSLLADLGAVRRTAKEAAAGARDVRTGVERPDEVGDVARALDDLIERLDGVERERARTEAARREFLAATSHDLRTPLTSLRAALEALQDGVADDPERYLRAMGRDIAHLASLVDDLWLLAQIELGAIRLQREPLDLAEIAHEAVEALGPLASRRGIVLQLRGDGPVPVSGGDRELGRVIRNLVDNAVRHSPPSGTVTVEVSGAPQPSVRVIDTGPGFPDGFRDQAFDPFTRADAARPRDGTGAGLGLAIARGFVQAHGGTITIGDGPGGQVVVRLPA